MDQAIRCVKFAVMLVVIVVWAVIGMMFWLPLLVRATSAFSVRVLHSTLTGQAAQGMDAQLESACGFYILGFKTIADIAWSSNAQVHPVRPRLSIVLVEIFWTAVVWITASALMGLESARALTGNIRELAEGLLHALVGL